MHILITNFQGPNIGLYGFANNKFCLLAKDVPKKMAEEVSRVLKVPVHRISICGTNLIGVFVVGNNKKILIPDIAFEREIEELKKIKIDFEIIKTKHTSLGNNILCNDNGLLTSVAFDEDTVKQIEKALGMKAKKMMIANTEVVGSVCVHNHKGGVVHPDAVDKEIKAIEKTLGIRLTIGTVCMGNPYVRCGVICNDYGFVVGANSGGPEIANIDEALGFLNEK